MAQHQEKRRQQNEQGTEREGNERSQRKLNQMSENSMKGAIAEYRKLVETSTISELCFFFQGLECSEKHMIRRKSFTSQEDENVLAELVRKRWFPLMMEDI